MRARLGRGQANAIFIVESFATHARLPGAISFRVIDRHRRPRGLYRCEVALNMEISLAHNQGILLWQYERLARRQLVYRGSYRPSRTPLFLSPSRSFSTAMESIPAVGALRMPEQSGFFSAKIVRPPDSAHE